MIHAQDNLKAIHAGMLRPRTQPNDKTNKIMRRLKICPIEDETVSAGFVDLACESIRAQPAAPISRHSLSK